LDPGPFVQRDDDTEEALRRQLESWREEAEEIKEHYDEQGILTVIDAGREVPEITEEIIEALGNPPKR
jgi:adenylate kinase